MGYDLAYEGAFTITPALAAEHRAELGAFYETRHAEPGARCCWRLATAGSALEWDGCEKFGAGPEALRSLIAIYFAPWGYAVEGTVRWRGEDDATGTLSVSRNVVNDAPDDPEPSVDEEVRSWLALIRSDDVGDRFAAASMLSCAVHGSPETLQAAVDALADALEPADVAVRALETLGEIGESAAPAVSRVLPMLESPSPLVRYWATFALGRMGPPAREALPALERLRGDREDGPRYGAIDAIKRLG